jgi:hypothetical protein
VSLIVWFGGCAHLLDQWQGAQDLRDARRLLSTGQFPASEQKSSSVLQAFPKALGDEALFQLGLIYSHPENPTANYEKSRDFFEKLLTQYPDSRRRDEAKAFHFALNRILDNNKDILELQDKVRLLELASDAREKTLRQLQDQLRERKRETTQPPDKKVKQLQEDLEDRKREITEYLETVSQLQNRVIELESQLTKFKDIDLTIEQKKRATTP